MINPFSEINWHPNDKDIAEFGKTLLIGFSIISLLFFLISLTRMSMPKALCLPVYLLAIAYVVSVLCFFMPKAVLPFYYIWFAVSGCIGIVISNLILLIFYYLFFSVFAVIFRACTGRDPLCLKKPVDKQSYWLIKEHKHGIKRYTKQY